MDRMRNLDWGAIRQKPDSAELRQARRYAHTVFDGIWKSRYQRSQAYAWLARQMKLTDKECHIARMNLAQCQEVTRLVRELRPVIQDRDPNEKRFERRRKDESPSYL